MISIATSATASARAAASVATSALAAASAAAWIAAKAASRSTSTVAASPGRPRPRAGLAVGRSRRSWSSAVASTAGSSVRLGSTLRPVPRPRRRSPTLGRPSSVDGGRQVSAATASTWRLGLLCGLERPGRAGMSSKDGGSGRFSAIVAKRVGSSSASRRSKNAGHLVLEAGDRPWTCSISRSITAAWCLDLGLEAGLARADLAARSPRGPGRSRPWTSRGRRRRRRRPATEVCGSRSRSGRGSSSM